MSRLWLLGSVGVWLLSVCRPTPGSSGSSGSPCAPREESRRFVQTPVGVRPSNPCLLNCTVRTYMKIMRRHKRLTVRLHSSVTASDNEYCWPSHLRCRAGERLNKAFVVLRTNEEGPETSTDLGLSSPEATSSRQVSMRPDRGNSIMSEECGIKFDTTELFKTTARDFCVQLICQDRISTSCDSLNSTLKCAPFLATIWSRSRQSLG